MSTNYKELLTSDLWELLPIGVTTLDAEGTILWANDKACELFNLKREQIIGKSCTGWGAIHEDGSPFLVDECACCEVVATGKEVRRAVMGINNFWLSVDSIPKLNDRGEVVGVICTYTDITAQKNSEKQKDIQARRIQSLFDNSFNGIVILQDDKVIEANARFAQMLGYTMTELLQLTPKDWEPEIIDRMKPIGVERLTYETVHYCKDGSCYDAEVAINCSTIEGKDFYLFMVKDITHQKMTEKALKESREQFINIFRSVSDAVVYIDRDYIVRFANNSFLERFELVESKAINLTLSEVIGEELFNEIKSLFDECLTGKTIKFHRWINYRQSCRCYVGVIYSPYRNNEGQILGVVATSRDLTAQRLIEENLETQRLQDHLIATIANELLKTFDYYAIFDVTLPIVRGYFNCDRVVIFEFKPNSLAEVVQLALAPGVETKLPQHNKFLPSAHIWEPGYVHRIADVDLEDISSEYREFLYSHNIKSRMILGIWSDNKLWGAIVIHQSTARSWTESDAEFLSRIAMLIGIAIYQSKLYQNNQIQLAQTQLLYRVANYIKQTIDLTKIFSYIVQEVARLYSNSATISISEFVHHAQEWQIKASYPSDLKGYTVTHKNNHFGEELLQQRTVVVNDTNSITDPVIAEIAEEFSGAWLLVPIVETGEVWGCLGILNSAPTIWTEEIKQFAHAITDQITIAINQNKETTDRIKAETNLRQMRDNLEEMVINRTEALTESRLKLQLQYRQEQLLTAISERIRSSLRLDQILQTTVAEVKDLINNDRVLIYKIHPNGSGEVVAESVKPSIPSLMGMKFSPEVYPKDCYEAFLKGRIAIVNSLQEIEVKCLQEFMTSLGVNAVVSIGIIFDQQLWGLLILHECRNDRDWSFAEVDLIQKITVPISVAIKQASLYQRVEEQLNKWIELNHVVKAKLKQERLLNLILERIRWSFHLDEVLALITTELKHFLQCDRVTIMLIDENKITRIFQFPDDSPTTMFNCQQVLAQFKHGGYLEDRHRLLLPIRNSSNEPCGLLTIFHIVPTKHEIGIIKFLSQITNQIGIAIEKASVQYKIESELKQKSALLKEVHHRVKNNLQVMSSILRMQSRQIDKSLQPMIEDAQNRIQTMAIVHELLYSSNNFASINLSNYVNRLVITIFDNFQHQSKQIELQINIPSFEISLEKTIPLGLIFNELVTNALKYAFPDGRGKFTIDVTHSPKTIEIVVADNGVGLPPDFDINSTKSLGMLLISDLVDQLEGQFSCHNDNGTVFTIVVPKV